MQSAPSLKVSPIAYVYFLTDSEKMTVAMKGITPAGAAAKNCEQHGIGKRWITLYSCPCPPGLPSRSFTFSVRLCALL